MATGRTIFTCLLLSAAISSAQAATPEDFALWLEQVPGTSEVTVVGSFAVDGVQGWSWGIRHDPAAARIGDCLGDVQCYNHPYPDIDWCERYGYGCPCASIECPWDLLHIHPCSFTDFLAIGVYPDGITMAVTYGMPPLCVYTAVDHYEMLKMSYEMTAETATLAFCDDIGSPAVTTMIVHGGLGFPPARQRGLVLSFSRPFIRGDANGNGIVEIGDGIFVLHYLFRSGSPPSCFEAADANDDDAVDLADGVRIISVLFHAGSAIPEPTGACGRDLTGEAGALSCFTYEPCN